MLLHPTVFSVDIKAQLPSIILLSSFLFFSLLCPSVYTRCVSPYLLVTSVEVSSFNYLLCFLLLPAECLGCCSSYIQFNLSAFKYNIPAHVWWCMCRSTFPFLSLFPFSPTHLHSCSTLHKLTFLRPCTLFLAVFLSSFLFFFSRLLLGPIPLLPLFLGLAVVLPIRQRRQRHARQVLPLVHPAMHTGRSHGVAIGRRRRGGGL